MRSLKSRLNRSFLETPLAHRGLHDHAQGKIENSRSAFLAAIERGYGIELDVQSSRDGRPMVFHDALLDRLTASKGNTNKRSAQELAQVNLVDGRDTIEPLDGIFNLVAGQVPLLVEVKDQDGLMGANIGAFVEKIAAASAEYASMFGAKNIALMSFNPYVVARLRQLLPELALGLVTDDFVNDPSWSHLPPERAMPMTHLIEVDGLEFDFISHNVRYLKQLSKIDTLADTTPILCWTVKTSEQERVAREIADNITFEGYLA